MDQKIIEFLSTCEESIETLKIAKAVGLKTTKEVNPTLYSLLSKGKVTKSSNPDGSKPKWSIVK